MPEFSAGRVFDHVDPGPEIRVDRTPVPLTGPFDFAVAEEVMGETPHLRTQPARIYARRLQCREAVWP
jgi:hypothetical protein